MSASSSASSTPAAVKHVPSLQGNLTTRLSDFPWWLLFILMAGVFLVYNFATNATYKDIITYLAAGIRLTITITLIAFAFSLLLGLITAFGQMSQNILIKNIAMLYVQVIRGVPALVLIFYTALVIIPLSVDLLQNLGTWSASLGVLPEENFLNGLNIRNVSFLTRGIIALAINYGAFSSEIFRAGIQSIERGQIEAAHALGFNWFRTMRLIILPQAIRRVLPPLGNDFIAMLKESSLVSVLGVGEITQLGKKYSAASFLYPETYNTVAFLYLSMTLFLSMGVKFMEQRLKTSDER
jgi:polar amino acid transport system permease protein